MDKIELPIDGIEVFSSRIINNPKGNIFHALKTSDPAFSGFGEAYFSEVYEGQVKGWKKHKRMVMTLVVPQGRVGLYFYNDVTNDHFHIEIGETTYMRVTVRPGIWMAFEGLQKRNLLLNIASIVHDPNESINAGIAKYPLIK